MSQNSKSTYSASYKGATASMTNETSTPYEKFPYGCQWGCGRLNVVSSPGNSCGRASCNDARSAKSMVTIAITCLVPFASAASQVSCQSVLQPILNSGRDRGVKTQLTVVQPNGVVAYAQNLLSLYMGDQYMNGNGFDAFLSSETSCVAKKVQPFAVDKKKISFYGRAGLVLYPSGKFSLSPLWMNGNRISDAQLTCLSNGQNYAVVDGVIVSLTFGNNAPETSGAVIVALVLRPSMLFIDSWSKINCTLLTHSLDRSCQTASCELSTNQIQFPGYFYDDGHAFPYEYDMDDSSLPSGEIANSTEPTDDCPPQTPEQCWTGSIYFEYFANDTTSMRQTLFVAGHYSNAYTFTYHFDTTFHCWIDNNNASRISVLPVPRYSPGGAIATGVLFSISLVKQVTIQDQISIFESLTREVVAESSNGSSTQESEETSDDLSMPDNAFIEESEQQPSNNVTTDYLLSLSEQQLFNHLNSKLILDSRIDYNIIYEAIKLPEYQDNHLMVSVFNWLSSIGCKNLEIYNHLLAFFKSQNNQKQFFKAYDNMRRLGVLFDVNTFNIVIGFYGDLGMQKVATSVVREFQNSGITPNLVTYVEMLRCFHNNHHMVDNIISDMHKRNIARNEVINALLIHIMLTKYSDIEKAIYYYGEIKLMTNSPSPSTFHSLLVGLAHIGRFDLLKHYWREMEAAQVTPSEATITGIIKTYAVVREVGSSLEFFRHVLQTFPDVARSPSVLCCLLHVLLMDRRHDQLTELLDFLEANNLYTLEMYNNALSVFARFQSHAVCERLYANLIRHFTPDVNTFMPLIYVAVNTNNFADCHRWLTVMESIGVRPNAKIYTYVMRYYLRIGKFAHLQSLIRNVVEANLLTPSSFSAILVFHEINDRTDSLNFFMRRLHVHTRHFIEATVDIVLQTYLMMDQYQLALEWFERKMNDYKCTTSSYPFLYFISYHSIRKEHAEVQYWENKMRDHNLETDQELRTKVFYHFSRQYKSSSYSAIESIQKLKKEEAAAAAVANQEVSRSNQEVIIDDPVPELVAQQSIQSPTIQSNTTKADEIDFGDDMDNDIHVDVSHLKQETSTFKDLIQESPYNLRIRITSLIQKGQLEQAAREFKVKEEAGSPIDGHSYFYMIRAFIDNNDFENTASYLIRMVKAGHNPVMSLLYDAIDLQYRSGKKTFSKFAEELAPIKPSNFDEVYTSVLMKNDMKKGIRHVQTVDDPEPLHASTSVRNSLIYGLTHRMELELAEDVVLSLITMNRQLSYVSLSFLLKTFIERDQVPRILNELLEYYKTRAENEMPVNLFNCRLLSLMKSDQWDDALHELNIAVNRPKYINSHTIPLAMRIYAHKYPIPPEQNIVMWHSVKRLSMTHGISTQNYNLQYFKCLEAANRPDLILEYANKHNFFDSQPLEIIMVVLRACPNDKMVIHTFKSILRAKGNLKLDEEAMKIIREANKTINAPEVDSYKIAKQTKIPNPAPMIPNIGQYIRDNFIGWRVHGQADTTSFYAAKMNISPKESKLSGELILTPDTEVDIATSMKRTNCFQIKIPLDKTSGKFNIFYCSAQSPDDMEQWIIAINQAKVL
eukprot:gene14215-16762_t